jgi:hypothetical protein
MPVASRLSTRSGDNQVTLVRVRGTLGQSLNSVRNATGLAGRFASVFGAASHGSGGSHPHNIIVCCLLQ